MAIEGWRAFREQMGDSGAIGGADLWCEAQLGIATGYAAQIAGDGPCTWRL
jgi:hypothetical protein